MANNDSRVLRRLLDFTQGRTSAVLNFAAFSIWRPPMQNKGATHAYLSHTQETSLWHGASTTPTQRLSLCQNCLTAQISICESKLKTRCAECPTGARNES